MARHLIQDIVSHKEELSRRSRVHEQKTFYSPKLKMKSPKRKYIYLGIFLLGVVIFFYVSSLFSGVVFKVTPRQQVVDVDNSFSISSAKGSIETIGFEYMTFTLSDSTTVTATSKKFVERKATGKAILYNNYSPKSQLLISNTRLQSTAGKIYRISSPAIVPGTKLTNGKIIPGQVEVTVFADKAGDIFNSDATDFTIPGFAGSPRFEKFYGRSVGALSGGMSGEFQIPDEKELTKAKDDLTKSLSEKMLTQADGETPEGFVLVPDASFGGINFPETLNEGTDKSKVVINASFEKSFMILNIADLARVIAAKQIVPYSGEPVRIEDISSLSLSLIGKETFQPKTDERGIVRIKGTTRIIFTYDEKALKYKLLGLSGGEYAKILPNFPAIERDSAEFSPPWSNSFPSDSDRINIEEKIDSNE